MRAAANIFRLGTKELRSLARDPVMLLLVIWSFSLAIYSSATNVPETLSRAPIAIVDEDQSQLSARIVDAFYPPFFTPPSLITPAEMDARLDDGRDTFALVLPGGLERDVLRGSRPTIQLNIDATRMSQAFTGGGYVTAIVTEEIAAYGRRHRGVEAVPVELVTRAQFNPLLNRAWFGAVVEIINNLTLLSIILTGAALMREREHGTIEHLLVMPVTPLEIMLSKVWSMGAVVLLAATLALLVIVRGLLGMPAHGSIALFVAAAGLHLFATTSMGIFLATLARSMPQFGLLIILTILPLQMLSGGETPRESMPDFIQLVMSLAPTTHFVALAQAILFRGAGLSVIWPDLLALAVIGAVFFAVSLGRFRGAIATMG